MHKFRIITFSLLVLPCLFQMGVSTASALDHSVLSNSVKSERAARYEAFREFKIKGICGTARLDLAVAYGANTIRTYTPPSREQLDEYKRLGLKVVVGIWMPHQGENSGKKGKWDYDYRKQSSKQVKSFAETLDRIGNHPAILLWCLGNEVPLDPAYLKVVNLMSQTLHKKYPKQLSSLTMINAPKEKIAVIKQYATDLDVIGFNSYGAGAVVGGCKNLEEEWGRAYYVSEFGPQGPWWGRKTEWGVVYEQSYDAKLTDLRRSFQQIDASPRCLGSTMFLWGYWSKQKQTYFSAFLSPSGTTEEIDEKNLYITPMAEEFSYYWSGKYPPERGPVLTKLNIAGMNEKGDAVVEAGKRFEVTAVTASPDSSASELSYRWWILDENGKAVVGPIDTEQPSVELEAPAVSGKDDCVMAYVLTKTGRASGFTVPIKVQVEQAATGPIPPE